MQHQSALHGHRQTVLPVEQKSTSGHCRLRVWKSREIRIDHEVPFDAASMQCNRRSNSRGDCRRKDNETEHFTWISRSEPRHKSSRVKGNTGLVRHKSSTIEMHVTKMSRNRGYDREWRKFYLWRRVCACLLQVSADRNFE